MVCLVRSKSTSVYKYLHETRIHMCESSLVVHDMPFLKPMPQNHIGLLTSSLTMTTSRLYRVYTLSASLCVFVLPLPNLDGHPSLATLEQS
jgi:hypothetical protein